MTLDGDLREVLTEQADRVEGPAPDIAAIRDGGLRMRRRRRRVVGASSALVALLVVGLGVGITEGLRDSGATDLPAGPPAGVGTGTEVPWCVGPDSSGGQRILGEGAPIGTLCHGPRGVHLWHHAGTTVLTKNDTTFRVADGELTPMGAAGLVRMSHDGRLAAWLGETGGNCGVLTLEVYEVATATRVASTEADTEPCGLLAGIDDQGRVYVTVVSRDEPEVLSVRMFDTATAEWTRVSDLPARHGVITYVTADGFAVQIAEDVVSGPDLEASIPLASLEGRVDADGRFVAQREVPIGRGRWSPDRSLVADQQPEGVVVRSADLTRRLALDLPRDLFAARPERLPEVDLIWESPTSLLAVSGLQAGSQVYRCDVRSGSCERVDRLGNPALGNGAQPGG